MFSSLKEKAQRGVCLYSRVHSHEWQVAVNRSSHTLFLTTKCVKVNWLNSQVAYLKL